MIRVSDIKRVVADHYGLPLSAMGERFGPWATLAHPRQVAMCLATRLTDHSFHNIGRFFGDRDPTTVRHAMNATEKRAATSPATRVALRRLTLNLVHQGQGR